MMFILGALCGSMIGLWTGMAMMGMEKRKNFYNIISVERTKGSDVIVTMEKVMKQWRYRGIKNSEQS